MGALARHKGQLIRAQASSQQPTPSPNTTLMLLRTLKVLVRHCSSAHHLQRVHACSLSHTSPATLLSLCRHRRSPPHGACMQASPGALAALSTLKAERSAGMLQLLDYMERVRSHFT